MEVSTPHGPARVRLDTPPHPSFLVVLTHGAGGGVDTPDLLAVRDAVVAVGGTVARVLQPYRVAGRRTVGPAVRQDEAWTAVVGGLRGGGYGDLPLVVGGRSNGARVACRTARATGAQAVIALAFPLHPPGRPERSRAAELREAGTRVLVVNGEHDPFGVPDPADATDVVVAAGETHALGRNPRRVADVVAEWLTRQLKIT